MQAVEELEKIETPSQEKPNRRAEFFSKRHDDAAIVRAWQLDAKRDPEKSNNQRIATLAEQFGCAGRTLRRIVTAAGLIGGSKRGEMVLQLPSKAEAAQKVSTNPAAQAAQSIMLAARAAGLPLTPVAAGVVLGTVMAAQKGRVAEAGEAVTQVSADLRALSGPQYDESGNRLPTDEARVHRAIASAERLVNAITKLHEEERRVWGIRDEAGKGESWADTLTKLDAAQVIDGQLVMPGGSDSTFHVEQSSVEQRTEPQVPDSVGLSESIADSDGSDSALRGALGADGAAPDGDAPD